MMRQKTDLTQRVTELRSAFDRNFAEAPATASESPAAFLAIDIDEDAYALRLNEIAGLYADRKIVPLPGAAVELLGLTSFRGVLVPVYDLRMLLGYSSASSPRWLVSLVSKTPVAIAFEHFNGYLSATRDEIARDAAASAQRHLYATEAVHAQGQSRLIVSLAAVLESIRERAQLGARQGRL